MLGEIDLRASLARMPPLPQQQEQINLGEAGIFSYSKQTKVDSRLVHELPLAKPSEGIVFIKLDFTKLYTHPGTKIPAVRCISIVLRDDLSKSAFIV